MAKVSTIIEALQDKRLLGGLPAFRDLSTWSRWLIVLKALYGLPLNHDEERLFCHHTGRSVYRRREGGFLRLAVITGRQSGKDRTASAITAYEAMRAHPESDGTDVYCLNVAQDSRSSLRTQRMYCLAPFEAVPVLQQMVVKRTADTIALDNGISIACYPCRPAAVRGVRARVAVLQELAFYRNSENQDVSTEMMRAIGPTLATAGGRLIIMSSPYAASGSLFELHRSFYGKDDADTLVWTATAPEMNPMLKPTYLKQLFESDPDGYRSEVMGEFRSGVATLLDASALEAVTDTGTRERQPQAHLSYSAFYDPSGGRRDAACLAVCHRDDQKRLVLDVVRRWPAPHNPSAVIAEASVLAKAYGIRTLVADKYAAGFPTEQFQLHNISLRPSPLDKSALFLESLPLINSARVVLLDDPVLQKELRGLERRRGSAGRDRVDHRVNAHDDCANAACGALVLAARAASHGAYISLIRVPQYDNTSEYVKRLRAEKSRKRLLEMTGRAVPSQEAAS